MTFTPNSTGAPLLAGAGQRATMPRDAAPGAELISTCNSPRRAVTVTASRTGETLGWLPSNVTKADRPTTR